MRAKEKLATFATITISFLFYFSKILSNVKRSENINITYLRHHLSKNLYGIHCNLKLKSS